MKYLLRIFVVYVILFFSLSPTESQSLYFTAKTGLRFETFIDSSLIISQQKYPEYDAFENMFSIQCLFI